MEDLSENLRICVYPGCNQLIYRPNQKFCSLQHKNAYHYQKQKDKYRLYQIPDKKLHRNNEVLKKYFELSRGEEFINQGPLLMDGLDTNLYTRIMKNNETGETLYVLYDHGFVINSSKQIKIHFQNGGFPTI